MDRMVRKCYRMRTVCVNGVGVCIKFVYFYFGQTYVSTYKWMCAHEQLFGCQRIDRIKTEIQFVYSTQTPRLTYILCLYFSGSGEPRRVEWLLCQVFDNIIYYVTFSSFLFEIGEWALYVIIDRRAFLHPPIAIFGKSSYLPQTM